MIGKEQSSKIFFLSPTHTNTHTLTLENSVVVVLLLVLVVPTSWCCCKFSSSRVPVSWSYTCVWTLFNLASISQRIPFWMKNRDRLLMNTWHVRQTTEPWVNRTDVAVDTNRSLPSNSIIIRLFFLIARDEQSTSSKQKGQATSVDAVRRLSRHNEDQEKWWAERNVERSLPSIEARTSSIDHRSDPLEETSLRAVLSGRTRSIHLQSTRQTNVMKDVFRFLFISRGRHKKQNGNLSRQRQLRDRRRSRDWIDEKKINKYFYIRLQTCPRNISKHSRRQQMQNEGI